MAAFVAVDRLRDIRIARTAALDLARSQIQERVSRGAERQQYLFSEVKVFLRQIADSPFARKTSPTDCHDAFQSDVKDLPWLLSVSIVDPRGQLVCTSAESPSSRGVMDRAYFREVLSTRAFVISDFIISRQSGNPIIVAAMPRLIGGSIESVVIVAIDAAWFGRVSAPTETSSQSDLLVVDKTGTVIAALPDAGLVGKNLGEWGALWKVLQGSENKPQAGSVVESDSLDGTARLVGFANLPDTGGALIVSRERAQILAPVHHAAWLSATKLSLLGLACLLTIWFGAERLVIAPISALTEAAAQLGSNSLTQVDTKPFAPELRLLGDTFNAMAVRLSDQERELRDAILLLQQLATRDGLTDLANRRWFDERIEIEGANAARQREPLGLIMVDIDYFKQFNDHYGHIAGDKCLKSVADALRVSARRPTDLAARTGGEEFAVLLPGCSAEAAAEMAEQIRRQVERLNIPHAASATGKLSVSLGVAALYLTPSQPVEHLLNAADRALYAAKHRGRNRIILYQTRAFAS